MKRHHRKRRRSAQAEINPSGSSEPKTGNGRVAPSESLSGVPSKIGPGQVFIRELIDASSGHAKRFRNVGESALSHAYYRGQLRGAYDEESGITAGDRFSAGQRFAEMWRVRIATSSTSFEVSTSGVGNDRHWWTDKKAEASEAIRRWQLRMYPKNFVIVQRFCGEDFSMPQSLTGVVEVHRNSVVPRVREALDDLVTAMTGRVVSTVSSTPGTVHQRSGNGR